MIWMKRNFTRKGKLRYKRKHSMTVEEFLDKIKWNRVFYDKEVGNYEIVLEDYDEVYERYILIKDLEVEINKESKTIIIRY